MFQLVVQQHPKQARQCSGKDRVDRRPIDPPPIVQVISTHPGGQALLDTHSPYLYVQVMLVDPVTLEEVQVRKGTSGLVGNSAQSMKRVKGPDNCEMGVFLFQDISVRIEGVFRLKFSLYHVATHAKTGRPAASLSHVQFSEPFQVYPPKLFPGMAESTFLTRLCASQGFRVRIRRSSSKHPADYSSPYQQHQPTFGPPHPQMRRHSLFAHPMRPYPQLRAPSRRPSQVPELAASQPKATLCTKDALDINFSSLFQDFLLRKGILKSPVKP
ncbi:hypothetical protein DSO57_1012944 [Entomophthora muscae]|uniref:Uncharacterized protein n=2 Tax=Entomophthora muscae TaxID=34485 RepID=A0ACC2SUM7_9FUNG|nr:hypothetical protein DSO57_1015365 [Entomophthora muscae]KAJ9066099.1 hypothetical protein DSO57_1012944 [Entomophthora muscae]